MFLNIKIEWWVGGSFNRELIYVETYKVIEMDSASIIILKVNK